MGPDPKTGRHPNTLAAKVHRTLQHLAREYPVFDDVLLVIQIVDEQIERGQPLLEPFLDRIPLEAAHHARDHIERPCAVDIAGFAIDREGDAHRHDGCLYRLATGQKLFCGQRVQIVKQRLRRRPRLQLRVQQLIVGGYCAIFTLCDFHDRLDLL